jgi:PAS domain S-box-containing protein
LTEGRCGLRASYDLGSVPDTVQRDVEPHALPPAREEWRIPADPLRVPSIRRGVRRFAAALGAPEPSLANLSLAVTEAVTNAVLHAYVDLDPGEVTVLAQAAPDEVIVAVLDDGRGMQPRPDSPGLGMGLPMIGQLTTSVDIRERPAGGTEVRMRFAAPGVHGRAAPAEPDARLQLLVEVARLAQSGGWPQEGVGRLVHLLVPSIADACALDRVHDWGLERLADAGAPAPALDAVPAEAGVQVVDVEPEPGADDPAYWVVVPLRDDERAIGLLRLGLTAGRGRPETQELVFLETLGERAARGLARTQLVADLRRTRQRVERILGALAEAVTVNDRDGRTVFANAAAARLLGARSVEDVLAAEPGELAARFVMRHEDGREVGIEELPGRRLMAGLEAQPLLTHSVRRDTGEERWLLTKATLLDDDGERLAVNIIEDVTEAKRAERRSRFLAQAGDVLTRWDDPDRILAELATLLVPHFADYCAVDIVDERGELRRVAVAHADPGRVAFVQELERRYPAAPGEATRALLAGGPPLLLPELTDAMLRSRATDARHLELLRRVGLRSVLMLPLRAGDRTLGTLTLLTAESGRSYNADDLAFGEDLARRTATAVERARRRAAP